ncbi:MAG: nuclear transport factor 2 family protein [Candidatus Solibacter usitatus]|nr:nuclear transport factor 2 family protein [Candidatus Solibacter usitatus]
MDRSMIIDNRARRQWLAGGLLLLLPGSSRLVAADPADAVRTASKAWRDAVIRQDAAALQRLLADDLVYAHSSGKTESKAEYIMAVTKPPAHYESFTESTTKVRVYGDAAVLEGHVVVKPAGRDSYRVRTLEVYVKHAGQWQMTAHQSARLAP